MCPGARWNTKRWRIDRFTVLVQKLLAEGEAVVLLGSPDEKRVCDEIERAIRGGGRENAGLCNLAGRTDLGTMIAVLARSRLVIAHDSGPIHLAAALGKEVVAIYGPTAPAYAAPYGRVEQVVRHEVPCHPCRRRECGHHSCMNGLTVEVVWEKTRGVIKKRSQAEA